eukprot:COSAG02_NODE_141_length_34311_cov_54.733135_27_plen_148_part_00
MVDIGEGHADMGGKYSRAVGKYLQGNMTVPRLREMRGLIKGAFHRPVSTMTMDEAVEYIFWTAKELGWSWSQLDDIAPKRRQARTGSTATSPPALSNAVDATRSAFTAVIPRPVTRVGPHRVDQCGAQPPADTTAVAPPWRPTEEDR